MGGRAARDRLLGFVDLVIEVLLDPRGAAVAAERAYVSRFRGPSGRRSRRCPAPSRTSCAQRICEKRMTVTVSVPITSRL
jgi:hypothetical protein